MRRNRKTVNKHSVEWGSGLMILAHRHFPALSVCLIVIMAAVSVSVSAGVQPNNQHEIKHLLKFIADSGCQLERNGKYHSASEALSHIKNKYDYFVDEIKTTEDFIRYSATKSLMSGKYYHVLCKGRMPVKTADWLLEELQRFRAMGGVDGE